MTSLYQEFLAKSLTDKYGVLSSQMDRIIHDANAEIVNLRSKVSGMVVFDSCKCTMLIASRVAAGAGYSPEEQ